MTFSALAEHSLYGTEPYTSWISPSNCTKDSRGKSCCWFLKNKNLLEKPPEVAGVGSACFPGWWKKKKKVMGTKAIVVACFLLWMFCCSNSRCSRMWQAENENTMSPVSISLGPDYDPTFNLSKLLFLTWEHSWDSICLTWDASLGNAPGMAPASQKCWESSMWDYMTCIHACHILRIYKFSNFS